ncbi:MAG TPA: hypothetical protein VFA26_15500 [Gemmataceae bacterium]|nr:hypothetical protein [Gemmataceae bacterium]
MVEQRLRRLEVLVERLAAALRGPAAPPPRRLQTAQDVIDLLQEQVEAVRAAAGAGAVEKARVIGRLAGLARQAIETGSLAARLERLEAAQRPGGR